MRNLISFIILIILVSIIFNGCAADTYTDTAESNSQQVTFGENTSEDTQDIYRIIYKDISFVSEDEKQAWFEPLLSLIGNEGYTVIDKNGDFVEYICPDPSKPSIEKGYGYGLLDVDIDGSPELIVREMGGVSGNGCFSVYDIITGEKLGIIGGDDGKDWCVYFNTQTGSYELLGQYQGRNGWAGTQRIVDKVVVTSKNAGSQGAKELKSITYLSAYYESTDVQETAAISSSFVVNEKEVSIDEYFKEYDCFVETYIRIPETEMIIIEPNDYETAEEIVRALLSTNQEFIHLIG